MAFFISKLRVAEFRKFKAPGLLFGGGLLAGLLLFLFWLALLPSPDQASLAEQPVTGVDAGPDVAAGVLGGITGGPPLGQARSSSARSGNQAQAQSVTEQPADAASGDSATASAELDLSDEQAIANGLLDGPSPAGAQRDGQPGLQRYYVEVERGAGVVELLEIDASSIEHAQSIVRDSLGNPKLLRGPSLQRLD